MELVVAGDLLDQTVVGFPQHEVPDVVEQTSLVEEPAHQHLEPRSG